MAFLPANKDLSLDAKLIPNYRSNKMPQWARWAVVLQVFIVFTYGSVAKWYPDWLNGTAPGVILKSKQHYFIIGELLQQKWIHYIVAYFGIIFDLIIIPMLLWKKTRLLGFYLSLFFHLFNSIVFQVGIFPYMSIAFALFFFSSETLNKRFLKNKNRELYSGSEIITPKHNNILIGIFFVYFIFQIGLPLRHWAIKDDVLWTEEGHRLSWRMMLRTKSGTLTIRVKDKATGEKKVYDYKNMLSKKQYRNIKNKPDLMWQFAQRIKEDEKKKGNDVAVYFSSKVSINGGPYFQFTNPDVDIAAQQWDIFNHTDWLLPSPEDYHKKTK
jgi:hypothetical protein